MAEQKLQTALPSWRLDQGKGEVIEGAGSPRL